MRVILAAAIICFLSQTSYAASITQARGYCADIAEAGVQLAEVKEKGAAKHVLVERAHSLYQAGELKQGEASAILWVIEYVYRSDETTETIRGPMFRQCLKEMGFNET